MLALRAVHYLVCRHGYEPALLAELSRGGLSATSPCSAVARVSTTLNGLTDPAYAIQILPHAVEVRAASIKALADGAADALGMSVTTASEDVASSRAQQLLASAPRGALSTHALVPDVLRGVPRDKAKLMRRCDNVADNLGALLRRRFAAARPRRSADGVADATPDAAEIQLQLLLLEPELLVLSIAPSDAHASGVGQWPVTLPGGYEDCSLDGDMPSSAYRKLLESFNLMCARPQRGERCVGALS
jgi:hypothetical protein